MSFQELETVQLDAVRANITTLNSGITNVGTVNANTVNASVGVNTPLINGSAPVSIRTATVTAGNVLDTFNLTHVIGGTVVFQLRRIGDVVNLLMPAWATSVVMLDITSQAQFRSGIGIFPVGFTPPAGGVSVMANPTRSDGTFSYAYVLNITQTSIILATQLNGGSPNGGWQDTTHTYSFNSCCATYITSDP